MTVKEVSALTGVSVRTLQYYDNIGLLPPARRTEAGYRIYDEEVLERLQQILLFRELEFSLKEIRDILSSPNFDRTLALQQQIHLLTMKRQRLDDIIALARALFENGGNIMSFKAFDNSKQAQYAQEAKQRWGKSEAYQEFESKSAGRTQETENVLGQGLMEIFARFGKIRDTDSKAEEAQTLVKELQGYITEHYYKCTCQIMAGLGQIYLSEEFMENIDAAGGEGTARFVADAIERYCR